jgi:hypothetical protein
MDIGELIRYLLTPVAQVALIMGLAELMKRSGTPSRFIPLFDLGLGLVSGICVYGLTMHYGITESIVLGIALGLSACGLFSGVKNVIETETEDDVMDYLEEEDNDEH